MKNFLNTVFRFLLGLKGPTKKANTRLLQTRGEQLCDFVIREASPQDIPALAALHVKTWNETYSGIKKPPTYEVRAYQWGEQFKMRDGSWFCLVVENPAGELIGFAKGMTYSSEDLKGYEGELNKIYLLRRYQRLGLGTRLFKEVVHCFQDKGIYSMVLFGVPQNPSCKFHEAMGGKKLYAKNGDFHGGYGWKNMTI